MRICEWCGREYEESKSYSGIPWRYCSAKYQKEAEAAGR